MFVCLLGNWCWFVECYKLSSICRWWPWADWQDARNFAWKAQSKKHPSTEWLLCLVEVTDDCSFPVVDKLVSAMCSWMLFRYTNVWADFKNSINICNVPKGDVFNSLNLRREYAHVVIIVFVSFNHDSIELNMTWLVSGSL